MKKKKKIVLLGPSRAAVSGVSTHLNQLFNSNIVHGYELCHFQVGSEGRGEGKLSAVWRYFSSPIQLLIYLRNQRPSVVHANTSLEPKAFWRDLVYVLVCKLLGIRVVYQVHGGALPQTFFLLGGLGRAILGRALRLADAIVLLASCEKKAYQQFANFRCVEVIPNAINLAEFAHLKAAGIPSECLTLGYVGRLADDKGIDTVLDALVILKHRGKTGFLFRIAGSGPYESELRGKVCELNLDGLVEFVGPVFGKEKMQFWGSIDLFVFPTFHREGLPYAVLESLASGTPLLTTPVGGISDAIEHEVHGVFVRPHDPAGVAEELIKFLDNRERISIMSHNCKKRAAERYRIEILVDNFSRLYSKVIAGECVE